MTCWPSRTSMPWRCSSNRIGSSTTSTPTGIPATPASSSLPRISRTARSVRFAAGGAAPRIVEYAAMQCSGCSHGQYSRWCTAAEPKSHKNGSPVRVSSA